MRIAVAVAAVVAALGLVACGGGGSTGSESESAEVAKGVALYREYQRLEAMAHKGDLRTGMAEEYGTEAEVENVEEETAEIRKAADKVAAEINALSNEVQRRVLDQVGAEP
jgi:hypothetical protein